MSAQQKYNMTRTAVHEFLRNKFLHLSRNQKRHGAAGTILTGNLLQAGILVHEKGQTTLNTI